MRNRRAMVIVGLCVFCLSAGIFPRAALARSWARAREPRRHAPARTMRYAGRDYRYHQGRFYRPGPRGRGYVVVRAPIGAWVPDLPLGYTIMIGNGTTYFYYHDSYYRRAGLGYVVAPAPVYHVAVAPQAAAAAVPGPAAQPAAGRAGQTYVVNIPNADGGYTPVTLVKSPNGYVGPQGEFYAQFPSVDQLQVMYGQ